MSRRIPDVRITNELARPKNDPAIRKPKLSGINIDSIIIVSGIIRIIDPAVLNIEFKNFTSLPGSNHTNIFQDISYFCTLIIKYRHTVAHVNWLIDKKYFLNMIMFVIIQY